MSCVGSADRPALTTRRAVHVTNAITVGRGQCMLVVLAQVCSGELFIDRARVARIRSCKVQGVRKAAQVAGDRIVGLGRGMRRHRRGPREKELQDQRACHLGHARPGCPNEATPGKFSSQRTTGVFSGKVSVANSTSAHAVTTLDALSAFCATSGASPVVTLQTRPEKISKSFLSAIERCSAKVVLECGLPPAVVHPGARRR